MRARPASGVDLFDIWMIDGELQYEAVWIAEVQRPAVPMVGSHHDLKSGVLGSGTNRLLLFVRHKHRDVPEKREGGWCSELLGEPAIGELEESEAPTVSELVHGVAELLLLATHQVLDLGPRGDEGNADDILVEPPSGLLIGGDEGVVV